jgi:transcriptional regulator with XRE-family HTH domain
MFALCERRAEKSLRSVQTKAVDGKFALCKLMGMDKPITPTELAAALGISVSYASQLLSGARSTGSSDIALGAFRLFGLKLGLLADMTDDDVSKLCAQQCHAATDTPPAAPAAPGKSGGITDSESLSLRGGTPPPAANAGAVGSGHPAFAAPAPLSGCGE